MRLFSAPHWTGMTPSRSPRGLKTSTPTLVAAYTRPSLSTAMPSAPLSSSHDGSACPGIRTLLYLAKLRRLEIVPSGATSKASI